ncbi:MAG TPA: Nif3-like dinuclear metal center hexameric protein, partial [Chitinophagaceae bacterium]|nr:Nif3-like dinuclear metal center hexameric protein [Chitinophagaceae bacterium]
MRIDAIIGYLESLAHPSLQEHYDNAGLITGDPGWECTGMICSLDATEEVVREAMFKGCNLIIAHHPIVFGGLKKFTGRNYVERTIILAIKNDIAIYSIHTNLDNVIGGVSGKMGELLGLKQVSILSPREQTLKKLYTFAPLKDADSIRNAIFKTGAGEIGKYSECSFSTAGKGTFRPGEGTEPYVGREGERHVEEEARVEVIFPAWLEKKVISALIGAHPYEEVAYDIVQLANSHPGIGAGIIGELPEPVPEKEFLDRVRTVFGTGLIRHTPWLGRKLKRVAVCGGAGSFLISKA